MDGFNRGLGHRLVVLPPNFFYYYGVSDQSPYFETHTEICRK